MPQDLMWAIANPVTASAVFVMALLLVTIFGALLHNAVTQDKK